MLFANDPFDDSVIFPMFDDFPTNVSLTVPISGRRDLLLPSKVMMHPRCDVRALLRNCMYLKRCPMSVLTDHSTKTRGG